MKLGRALIAFGFLCAISGLAPVTLRAQSAESVLLRGDGAPFKGPENASLAVIEFSDYQCPFCARHVRETLSRLDKEYIETGKITYLFRDFPLESIHPQAFKAAEAARCAGEQGKYWQMHDRLFANQKALGRRDLSRHAQALELEVASFDRCLDSGKQAAKIRGDIEDGLALGVKNTPSFLLVLTDPNSHHVKAVRAIRGAAPYEKFQEALESLLAFPEK